MTHLLKITILLMLLLSCLLGESKGAASRASNSNLFNQFKIEQKSFLVEKISNDYSKANVKWRIRSLQNSQDSIRVLNITTVSSNGTQHKVLQITNVEMSEEICKKNPSDESFAFCNYTVSLDKCLNYVMRLASDSNIGGISTVPIKPSSLKVALEDITAERAILAVELDIECDNDYIGYVDFDVFENITKRRENGSLRAHCNERTCRNSTVVVKKLSYCKPYTAKVDIYNTKDFDTPPNISHLHLVKFHDNNAVIRWSINPPNCQLNPQPLIEKLDQTIAGRNFEVQLQHRSLSCGKGSCNFEVELEGCAKYVIYPNRLKGISITLIRPNIKNVRVEINDFKEGKLLVSWVTGCQHDQEVFYATLINLQTNEKIKLDLKANCTLNLQCHATVQTQLKACSQYKFLIDGSNETATIDSLTIEGLAFPAASWNAQWGVVENDIEVNVTLKGLTDVCTREIKTLEITLPFTQPEDFRQNLTCVPFGNEQTSISCGGKLSNRGLDICEQHQLHMSSLFSQTAHWSLGMNGTLEALRDRANDYDPIARVTYSNSSITAEIQWSDPVCLPSQIEHWDVEISNETHEQHLKNFSGHQIQNIPHENGHQYKLVTSDANLLVTTQAKNGQELENFGFELVPCSNYTVKLVPKVKHWVLKNSEFKTVKFTTELGNTVGYSLEAATAEKLDITISYPKQCWEHGLVQKISVAKIDGREYQINLDPQGSCTDDICFTRFQQRNVLTPCVNYNISVGRFVEHIQTPPDFTTGSPRNIRTLRKDSDEIEIIWDKPLCENHVKYWHFKLWVGKNLVMEKVTPLLNRSTNISLSSLVSEEKCLNFTYQIGSVYPANLTIYSETMSHVVAIGSCMQNSSVTIQASTSQNVKPVDWLYNFDWDKNYLEPWLILFAGLAAGYLLVASLVLIVLRLKKRKKGTRKRKISQMPLCKVSDVPRCLAELQPLY